VFACCESSEYAWTAADFKSGHPGSRLRRWIVLLLREADDESLASTFAISSVVVAEGLRRVGSDDCRVSNERGREEGWACEEREDCGGQLGLVNH
jgi:hypothetical protein